MRAFRNLFLTLVVPIVGLFTLAASILFSINFNLEKGIKLGILSGVIGGVVFSILITLTLLSLRKIRQVTQKKQKEHLEKSKLFMKRKTVVNHMEDTENNPALKTPTANKSIDQKLILLMDKELAFEVSLYAITDQNIGKVSNKDKYKNSIVINAQDETIILSVKSLTRHTSEVFINAIPNSKNVQKIISYIKEKELSFLDY